MTKPPISESELADLVRRLVAGDAQAAEPLLTALLPRVRNLVRYLIRGDQDVDDLSQEALLTLLRGFSSFRGEGSVQAWSDRVVARSVFAARRRGALREQATSAEPAHAHEFSGGSDYPAADALCQRREMVCLLDTLPDGQRSALVLHHVLGLTVSEIAEELAIPSETVRSRLRLGKDQLRKRLGARGRMAG